MYSRSLYLQHTTHHTPHTHQHVAPARVWLGISGVDNRCSGRANDGEIVLFVVLWIFLLAQQPKLVDNGQSCVACVGRGLHARTHLPQVHPLVLLEPLRQRTKEPVLQQLRTAAHQ